MALTYKGSGVDIKKIRQSHDRMRRLVSQTHVPRPGVRVEHGFGHYAGIVRAGRATLAVHTDGVGTKVMIANRMKKYDTIGIDCIAMNVNDIICMGATPVSFVDYIAANRSDEGILGDIMRGLVRGAKKADVPIVGGETAIMPDLFGTRGFAFDLAGTIVGTIPDDGPILGEKIAPGDAIIGAHSSGLHSNGYTLARQALKKYSLRSRIDGVGVLGDALLKPTRIYSGPVLEAIQRCTIHGLAHITGGSFAKLLRLKRTGFELDSLPRPPPIMRLIARQGVAEQEMYRTFNMGIGFCVIAPEDQADRIVSIFRSHRVRSGRIGEITRRRGVFAGHVRIA